MSAATTSVTAAPEPRADAPVTPAWPAWTRLDWTNILGYHVRCDRCPKVEILASRAEHVLNGHLLTRGLHWALGHQCEGAASAC